MILAICRKQTVLCISFLNILVGTWIRSLVCLFSNYWRISAWKAAVIIIWRTVLCTWSSRSRRWSFWTLRWNTCCLRLFKLLRLQLCKLLLYQLLLLEGHWMNWSWPFSVIKLVPLHLGSRRQLFKFFLILRCLALRSSYMNHRSRNRSFPTIRNILLFLCVNKCCILT